GVLDKPGTASIRLPPDELRSWAWCSEEQISERMSALLARRVIAALRAKAECVTFDLDNGFHVLLRRSTTRRPDPRARRVVACARCPAVAVGADSVGADYRYWCDRLGQ